jgi:hypothetical protein
MRHRDQRFEHHERVDMIGIDPNGGSRLVYSGLRKIGYKPDIPGRVVGRLGTAWVQP